jgi:hypothetical protein
MRVGVDSLGFILDVLSIFNVITAWGNNLSHKYVRIALSGEHNPEIKLSLNDLIARSGAFGL